MARKAVNDVARYIDADEFKSHLEKAMEKMHLICGVKAVDVGAVLKALDMQPTADVAQKSEVENYKQVAEYQQKLAMDRYFEIKRLQEDIETLKDNNEHLAVMLEEAKQEVAREIFEEIEKLLKSQEAINKYKSIEVVDLVFQDYLPMQVAKLKKKYTGEKDNES